MGIIKSGGLSTSEKLASQNPAARREGQKELAQESKQQFLFRSEGYFTYHTQWQQQHQKELTPVTLQM